MTKPMIREFNCETQETIDREMNDSEYAVYLQRIENEKIELAEAETKAQAKTQAEGKLAALGLTTDDLRALGL